MNKQVILSALQSQLETVRNAVIDHEKTVYEPAVQSLKDKIVKYFAEGVIAGIHDISLLSDSIVLYPSDNTDYYNRVTLTYRCNWRGENTYIDLDSYRPSMKSNEDNTQSLFYYETVCAVAKCFHNISKTYINKWQPALERLNAAKNEKYAEIYKIESEIRNCESEIATIEKEVYNQVGFECQLLPNTDYNTKNDDGVLVYVKKSVPFHIRAQYGRSKWDFANINCFKVISFPKSKFAKVVLEWSVGADNQKYTVELNKTRYAEFVDAVYRWQTTGAAEREANIDEKISRWNKTEA
jgi:hypothetical protein